jgi:phosphoribosyl 1,2-cyclic phosphodiesterase
MMKICSIASSSSGNCIYVGTDHTHILIDAGISGKRLKAGLEMINLQPENINAILITHEHSDHIKGLGVVSRKYNIPVYATELTWEKIQSSGLTGAIDKNLFHKITPDSDFIINELVIHPFNTSHDAVQPVCYTFTKEKKKISVATDLGCYDSYITEKLKDSNVLFIEANHDIEMLKSGSYPYYLKKRILSDKGHLSNEMSGRLISEVLHDNLQYIVLGHLSRENNHPDKAHESVGTILGLSRSSGPDKVCISDIRLIVSEREEVTGMIVI